jgi:hypothetical protein
MQRRSYMHRSPLNFWLLLAATLSLDAVVVFWASMTELDEAGNLYFGLVCSQISVACIGAFFSRRRWSWTGPLIASVFVAALSTWLAFERRDTYQAFLLYLSLWLPQVALLLAMLWLLQQTRYAARWGLPNERVDRWQFSVAHLLMIMTAFAVLIAIIRRAKEMHEIWVAVAAWTVNNVMLAAAALIIYATRWHRFLRLGAIIGWSLVLGLGIARISHNPDALTVNIIQSIVLFIWLAIGEIVPVRAVSGDDGNVTLTTS